MRLGNRAQRVGIELCKDKAQDTLMRELMALKDTYHKLTTMIEQVRRTFLTTQLKLFFSWILALFLFLLFMLLYTLCLCYVRF
jgi:hypothetical protein